MDKKADLLQSVSIQHQYENMLQDYADFLDTAQEKLKADTISARDLPHLKQQLAAHKVSYIICIIKVSILSFTLFFLVSTFSDKDQTEYFVML